MQAEDQGDLISGKTLIYIYIYLYVYLRVYESVNV